MPIRAFGKEHHRTISGLPLEPCVGGASGPRLMMSSWANEVNIWWIPIYDHSRTSASEESATLDKGQTRKLVAKIVIQVSSNTPSTIRMLSPLLGRGEYHIRRLNAGRQFTCIIHNLLC